MKIVIDREGCIECGVCASTCEAVFDQQPGQKSIVVPKYQKGGPDKGEVGSDLSDCTKNAADACPVQVISVTP